MRNQQPVGGKPELIEPGAIERASLEIAEIGCDPERLLVRFACERRERQCKARRCAKMHWRRRAHLMQCRALQAAAERCVDRPDTERARGCVLAKRFDV